MKHYTSFPHVQLASGANWDDAYEYPRSVGNWSPNIEWRKLERFLQGMITDDGLELEPDFQRGHVWTAEQQAAYVEHRIGGGANGRTLMFITDNWKHKPSWLYLLDGLQRITAVRAFLDRKIQAFGLYVDEFAGTMPSRLDFIFSMHVAKNRAEVLRYYLLINSGGTPHSQEALDKARGLLRLEERKAKEAGKKVRP